MTIRLPPCPRCGGRLALDMWERPPDIYCINCGFRIVVQTEEELDEDTKRLL